MYTSHPGLQNGLGQGSLTSEIIRQVEMFICKFYEAKSTVASVNDLHYKIFLQGNKEPEKLPPTHDALLHHIRRAHFQSYIWYHANEPQQELPSPVGNGWCADATSGNILPTLMSQPALPQNYIEITHCKCKNCATARCGCRKNKLKCTIICGCQNEICYNPSSLREIPDDSDDGM